MNAVEARKLAKEGVKDTRIKVISKINRAIEDAAKRHQTNEIITLSSKRPHSIIIKMNTIYEAPIDKESMEIYLNHLRIAGFIVTELFSNPNEARLHIDWEGECE